MSVRKPKITWNTPVPFNCRRCGAGMDRAQALCKKCQRIERRQKNK